MTAQNIGHKRIIRWRLFLMVFLVDGVKLSQVDEWDQVGSLPQTTTQGHVWGREPQRVAGAARWGECCRH